MDNNYGIITEQGDLGLGYSILSESDIEKLKSQLPEDDEKEKDSDK